MSIKETIQEIQRYCISHGITVSTIESCTAGELGSLFTTFSGSSKWYKGSIVPYSTEMKIKLLGIDEARLEEYTAVSFEIVGDMAKSGIDIFGTDLCISTSGYLDDSGGKIKAKHCYICIYGNMRDRLCTILKKIDLPFKVRHKNKELILNVIISWTLFALRWGNTPQPNA